MEVDARRLLLRAPESPTFDPPEPTAMACARHSVNPPFVARLARYWFALGAVAMAGCQSGEQGPTGITPVPGEAVAAKAGGGGGAGSTSPTVTSTNPAAAAQDTTLDVVIYGSGFATGAKATWALNGDTTLVHVKATKVVSSRQLVATVSVPAGAPVGSYDVQVMLVGGKKGVGAELFTVTLADPTVTWKLPVADGALAFRSDHQFADGTYSVYADGVCGVTTWVELASTDPWPGFAHVSLGQGTKGCKRTLTLVYPDGQIETAQGNSVQRQLYDPSTPIAPGTIVKRTLAINLGGAAGRCGRLLFGQGSQGAGVGSDSVVVARSLDGATWHVYSNSDPGHRLALCENTNQLFVMPVDFLIVADDPSRFP